MCNAVLSFFSLPLCSTNGEIMCQIQDGASGLYNTSFVVSNPTSGFGNALPLRDAWQVDPATGTLFQYKAHPTINYIPLNALGLGGASSLQILGSGFSWTPSENVVLLAGVPCVVTASTLTTITCTPGAAVTPTNTSTGSGISYPLGRGLVHSYFQYNNANWSPYQSRTTSLPSYAITWVNSDAVKSMCVNCMTNFVEDLKGFFIPPVTANYSFWVRGDDLSYVWLSSTSSPVGARLIASAGVTDSFVSNSAQRSDPQFLVAGRPYFFQARHIQFSGNTNFFVGLRIHTTGNDVATAAFSSPNQRVYDSVSEVQMLAVSTIVRRAQLTFFVAGVTSSSTFILSAGTKTFCIDCANGVYFTSVSSTGAFQNAFASYLGCYNFAVTRANFNSSSGTPGFQWTVTINCPLASAPTSFIPSGINLIPLPGHSAEFGGEVTVLPSLPITGSANFWYNATFDANGLSSSSPLTASLPDPYGVATSLSQQLLRQPGISNIAVTMNSASCNWAPGALFACDSISWMVTFTLPYGDIPQIVADSTSLRGSNATATAWTVIEGSTDTFLFPAPMDYFQVRIRIPCGPYVFCRVHGGTL